MLARRHVFLIGVLALLLALTGDAQITIPHTFVADTAISPDEVNTNFSTLGNGALNRAGGILTGNLTVNNGVTIDGIDLSAVLDGTGTPTFAGITVTGASADAVEVTGGVTAASVTATTATLTNATITAATIDAIGDVSNAELQRLDGVTSGIQAQLDALSAALAAAATVPSGTVAFFTLGACPSGWTAYAALEGRYAVGLPSGGTLEGTSGTALTDLEARAVGQHTHTAITGVTITDPGHDHDYNRATGVGDAQAGSGPQDLYAGTSVTQTTVETTGISASATTTVNDSGSIAGTPAPYVQLLACEKD